jgi:hypothetical protein
LPASERACGPGEWPQIFRASSSPKVSRRAPPFHFPEDALALHLLLQNTKRLVDIVVANKYLQLKLLAWLRNAAVLHAAN